MDAAVRGDRTDRRARTIELPDYYLVTGVDALTPTARHWYFGLLHAAAPTRAVPVDAAVDRVLGTLESLAPGPWWPPVDRLLAGIEHRAPTLLLPPDTTTTEAALDRFGVTELIGDDARFDSAGEALTTLGALPS